MNTLRHQSPQAAIAARLGGRLVAQRPLEGGVSADVRALDIDVDDGSPRTVVLRVHGAAGWKPLEGDVTAMEFALLGALASAGFEVPGPLLIDLSGNILDASYLVMEFVDGRDAPADLGAGLSAMAAFLGRLHDTTPAALDLPQLPRRDDPVPVILEYLPDRLDSLRPTIAAWDERFEPVSLLHGDFWPGNILWTNDSIASVIDWEDAALGDPACDLAGSRVELLWKYGEDAMHAFTGHYLDVRQIEVPDRRLAIWELHVASAGLAFMHKWGLDPTIEAEMRVRTDGFLDRAAAVLAAD